MYTRGMCWISTLRTHLSVEVTATISNTAISQSQKVVEQGGSLDWALVRDKISQSWTVNEVFLQKSGATSWPNSCLTVKSVKRTMT